MMTADEELQSGVYTNEDEVEDEGADEGWESQSQGRARGEFIC